MAPLTRGPCRRQTRRDREPTAGLGLGERREWGFHGDGASLWEDGPSWRGRWRRLHSSVTVPDTAEPCPEACYTGEFRVTCIVPRCEHKNNKKARIVKSPVKRRDGEPGSHRQPVIEGTSPARRAARCQGVVQHLGERQGRTWVTRRACLKPSLPCSGEAGRCQLRLARALHIWLGEGGCSSLRLRTEGHPTPRGEGML